ncbi:MAG: hypothetical protein CMI59_12015 [Parvibaculum sp.]|nr:hypothetical protein [Parvibaculum sp.]
MGEAEMGRFLTFLPMLLVLAAGPGFSADAGDPAAKAIEGCLASYDAAAMQEKADGAPLKGATSYCTDKFFEACAEGRGWTQSAMNECQGEATGYWMGQVRQRMAAVKALGSPEIDKWLEESAASFEAYRKVRCDRFDMTQGTMYVAIKEGCETDMARERAEDLDDFLGSEPLIAKPE